MDTNDYTRRIRYALKIDDADAMRLIELGDARLRHCCRYFDARIHNLGNDLGDSLSCAHSRALNQRVSLAPLLLGHLAHAAAPYKRKAVGEGRTSASNEATEID